jgi:hypothetical protein
MFGYNTQFCDQLTNKRRGINKRVSMMALPRDFLNIAILCAALVNCNSISPTDPAPTTSPKPKPNLNYAAGYVGTASATATELSGINFAPFADISAFLGGKRFKLAFCHNKRLYLLTSESWPTVTRLSQGDEGNNGICMPSSPLFSPDGKWLVYAGSITGNTVSFLHEAVAAPDSAWRTPITNPALIIGEPHWYMNAADTFVYFINQAPGKAIFFDSTANRFTGDTWRVRVTGELELGAFEQTGFPGAFSGGISRDGRWAGTAYAIAGLFDITANTTTVIACGLQHCNPSINPFTNSLHTDYLMMLGFGNMFEKTNPDGCASIVSVAHDTLYEGIHENIWIYSAANKVVWQGKLPDIQYESCERPEWSTHPRYATALAFSRNQIDCDLYIVRLPDWNAISVDSFTVSSPSDWFKVAGSAFSTGNGWSHLWVEP